MADDLVKWIFALAAIVLVGVQTGFIETKSTVGGGTDAVVQQLANTCSDPSNTLTLGPLEEWTNTGTSMTSENSRYWIDGVDQGTAASGGTATVGNGREVAIIHGYQSATFYSDGAVFTMPCAPTSSAQEDGGAHQLWRHEIAPTLTVVNSDTGNNNLGDGAANETIGSGETGMFKINFKTSDTNAFSPPRQEFAPTKITPEYFPQMTSRPEKSRLVAVVEFNGTMYDQALVTWTGGVMTKENGALPVFYNASNADSDTVVFTTAGCPTKDARSCDLDLGTLRVQAKSGENPFGGNGEGVADDIGLGDIIVTYFAEDWETHTEKPLPVFGTDQNDGTTATFPGIGDLISVD